MKTKLFLLLAIVLGIGLISFTTGSTASKANAEPQNAAFEIPENVQQVIDKSCYGCHNSESQSEKGKKKLQWDKLSELKTFKLVGTLTDVAEVVHENEMPPKDFLDKKPEAMPTAVEKKILADWAESTAKSLAE